MFSSQLLERTLHLVRNRPISMTYEKLAELSDLQSNWIATFAQGKMKEPGVSKVEALYNALAEAPLFPSKD